MNPEAFHVDNITRAVERMKNGCKGGEVEGNQLLHVAALSTMRAKVNMILNSKARTSCSLLCFYTSANPRFINLLSQNQLDNQDGNGFPSINFQTIEASRRAQKNERKDGCNGFYEN